MKKILIVLIICVLFAGCQNSKSETSDSNEKIDGGDNTLEKVTITVPSYFLKHLDYFVGDCEDASTPEEYLSVTIQTYDDAVLTEDGSIKYTVYSDEAEEGKSNAIDALKMDITELSVGNNITEITYDDTLKHFEVTCSHRLDDYEDVAEKLIMDAIIYNLYCGEVNPIIEVGFMLTDGSVLPSVSSSDLEY